MNEASERRGPRQGNRAIQSATPPVQATATPIVPRVALIGEVTLSHQYGGTHEGRRKRLERALMNMPNGARMIVHVEALRPDPTLVRAIRRHQDRLKITVMADPDVINDWHFWLNEGEFLQQESAS